MVVIQSGVCRGGTPHLSPRKSRDVLFVIKKHTIKTEWAVVEYRSGPPYPGSPYAQGHGPCIFLRTANCDLSSILVILSIAEYNRSETSKFPFFEVSESSDSKIRFF